jgi:N-acetylglucosamine kinase-like BadF-type ATPase
VTPLFLGLDGGGTKTAAAAVDAEGTLLGRALTGPSTYKSLGIDRAVAVLADAIASAADARPIARAVAGVSDVDTPSDRRAVADALMNALAGRGVAVDRLEVVNDAVVALASGLRGPAGLACIAGTGSVAFGVDGRGRELRAGGWGPPFGDAGAAYWIGFQAVSAALRRHDRGDRDAPLIRHLLAASGCRTLAELVYEHLGAAGEAGMARDRLPPLARAVEAAALAGDPDADAIFAAAGEALADLASSVINRLDLTAAPFDLVLVGSVWDTRAAALPDTFRARVAALAPSAALVRPTLEPARAAALLARDLARTGHPCPTALLSD